jgi:hypothetical protein
MSTGFVTSRPESAQLLFSSQWDSILVHLKNYNTSLIYPNAEHWTLRKRFSSLLVEGPN